MVELYDFLRTFEYRESKGASTMQRNQFYLDLWDRQLSGKKSTWVAHVTQIEPASSYNDPPFTIYGNLPYGFKLPEVDLYKLKGGSDPKHSADPFKTDTICIETRNKDFAMGLKVGDIIEFEYLYPEKPSDFMSSTGFFNCFHSRQNIENINIVGNAPLKSISKSGCLSMLVLTTLVSVVLFVGISTICYPSSILSYFFSPQEQGEEVAEG